VSEKPFVSFLFAFMASAVPVFGAAILLSLTVSGRELPRNAVKFSATLTDIAQASSYAKSPRPTAQRRVDPESATILATLVESLEPDPTGSVPDQPETATNPDAEGDPGLSNPADETNALTSAPAAMSRLSEQKAPEDAETIHSAKPNGGRLESNVIASANGPPPESVPQLLGKTQKAAALPTKDPNGDVYRAAVHAALARHKPRAVERGRTTVTFAIGASGAPGNVRVGQSSGNVRLDQVALQMVRDAAPFPPPPNGASSYTIRIDFQ
jgi:periplasmic protein TonB